MGVKVHYLGHWMRDLDQIQELMVTQEHPKSHQMHSNIPPADVQQYCNIMRNKYIHYQPNISDWPPKLKCGQQYFGRLTLTDRNTTQSTQWSMLRGHTDNVPEGPGKTIQMEDLIKPSESGLSLRVVVDGLPGIGKTTLCRILLNMWATKEQIKHLYDLVLYCPLRNDKIAQANQLKDLFYFKEADDKISQVVDWMKCKLGERVLMIFDGWDELSTQLKKSSLPTSIIQRDLLDKCSVLVTSRTYATSSLLNLTSHHKHVQVIGFSSDEVKTVIRGTLEEPNLAKKLIKDLKVRGDVLSLCYIPLVCSMVIYVYGKLKGQLPTTLTRLYENFILQTIRRHIERNYQLYSVGPDKILRLNERDLPPDVGRDFKQLCQFAYLSLKENNPKMTFSYNDLQNLAKSGYLGLITEYGEDGNQFLHLSIQEFLASWWIAKYEEKTQEIFNEHLDNDHFKMCLRFTAGLTHLEPNQNYQQYFNKRLDLQCKRKPWFGFDDCYRSRLYKNHEIDTCRYNHTETDDSNEFAILLLQLLYESQNTQLCSTLAQSMKNHSLCLRNLRLSLFDILCVSYFLNNSNITWNHIDLGELMNLIKQEIPLLNNTLTINSQHNKCRILEVELGYLTMETIKLFQLPLFQYIQECYVKIYDSHCNSFLYLLELLKLHHQLEILHFHSYLIGNKDVTPLSIEEFSQLTKLLNNSKLQELVILYTDAFDDYKDYSNEVTSLYNGVAMNKTITSFTAQLPHGISLSDETIQQLLMKNYTIQALDLYHLPSVNIVNTPLTTLRLNGDGDDISDQQTSFLPHIKELQCLILSNCSYPPNLIFQSLPSLQQLEILLDTVKRAIELFTILQSNVTLKALRVKIWYDDIYNRIGDSLCDMLRLNQTIKYLEIERERWRSIPSTSFLSYLTTGLSHNTSLQELSVSIPLSPTNSEQIITFFNVISKMNNLTELKVNFTLDQLSYSKSSSREEREQIMTPLYYEHGLPSLTNMIMSHSFIRLLHVTYDDIIYDLSLSEHNWVESVEQLYWQSIFIHPSLEYIRISRLSLLEDILQKQKKTLIDKRKRQQLLKPTPTIEFD